MKTNSVVSPNVIQSTWRNSVGERCADAAVTLMGPVGVGADLTLASTGFDSDFDLSLLIRYCFKLLVFRSGKEAVLEMKRCLLVHSKLSSSVFCLLWKLVIT